jgi:hypothetical protein
MTDCMLSEERIEALIEQLMYCIGGSGESLEDVIRRFFAPPPGSVKVEVAVAISGKERAAMVVNDDQKEAMDSARECIFATDMTHECYAAIYVPPVPPVPSVEVIQ